MKEFEFSVPQNIVFGSGCLDRLPQLAKRLKKQKAFILSGPHLNKIGLVEKCLKLLESEGIETSLFTETEANPSCETVARAAGLCKSEGADFIVAFGGGSPLDTAKAVAVLVTYGGEIKDYEGGGKVKGPVLPIIAIPTTAGTGSEVTPFSVITDHERNYKLTVSSNYLIPEYAILDPDMIETVPEKTAAACGIDALIHAIESYLSLAASPFSEMCSLRAIELIGKNIRAYVANRTDKEAAGNMLLGSLFAGIAFSHARLGNVHAMSHPVSAYFDVAHGVANAILLPVVLEFNSLTDKGKYYDIYKHIAAAPVKKEKFIPQMLCDEVKELLMTIGIPCKLSEAGVNDRYLAQMAEDAMKSGNIAVNPRSTCLQDILKLYQRAL